MPKTKKEDLSYSLKTLAEVGPIEFITSGFEEIDAITGGLPRARITEIHGLVSVGKTDFATTAVANMSHKGKILYIDAENAINPKRFLDKGATAENVTITDMHILEEVAKFTRDNIGKYDIIVIDSVASLIPKPEAEGQVGDQFIGLKARLMGQWMRQIIAELGKSKTALLFINQLREGMSMYIPRFTPGGHALPYAASLRLLLSTSKADRITASDGSVKGHKVHVEVTKSRVCKPHQKTEFTLEY